MRSVAGRCGRHMVRRRWCGVAPLSGGAVGQREAAPKEQDSSEGKRNTRGSKGSPSSYTRIAGGTRMSPENPSVLLTTRDVVQGRRIHKEIGIVAGCSVHTRSVFLDLLARFRSIWGGEMRTYSDLFSKTSQDATLKLMQEAQRMGASAVVRVRYQTQSTADPLSGIFIYSMAYGTAVVCSSDPIGAPTSDTQSVNK